jgi:MFS family permease
MYTLATAASSSSTTTGSEAIRQAILKMDILNRPDELLDILGTMPLIAASMILIVGVLCVLNGYRWHKWVIMVLAFLCGLGLGQVLSAQIGKSAVIAVALGLLFAIIATPMLKVAVAIFGGLTGAFIGANTWTAIQVGPEGMQWAGALMGFILLALLSLVLFRLVIVLFTSIGGAAMVVFGAITLLMHVPAWEPAVRDSLAGNQLLLPLLLALAAVSGFVIQESRVREENSQQQRS